MLIIGAPFGNWLKFEGALRTVGTYTRRYRAGLLKRIWRFLATVRYSWRQRSWINRLGLPNPGIESWDGVGDILSIKGFSPLEWIQLVEMSQGCVEFNLSCPNAGDSPTIDEVRTAVEEVVASGRKVIAKLPPIRWMDWVRPLWLMGVHCFHACNTIATPGGGISGKPLMQYSLWAVQEIRAACPDAEIIGGGGIATVEDVQRYLDAGADHTSIASMLINPLNWRRVPAMVDLARKCWRVR